MKCPNLRTLAREFLPHDDCLIDLVTHPLTESTQHISVFGLEVLSATGSKDNMNYAMDALDEEFCFSCKKCQAKFPSLRELRKHSNEHNNTNISQGNNSDITENGSYSTPINDFVEDDKSCIPFKSADDNIILLDNSEREPVYTQDNLTDGVIKDFNCGICGESITTTKWIFDQHVQYHEKKGTVPCQVEDCPKRFSTNRLLKSHELIQHNIGTPQSTICPICQYHSKSVSSLKKHSFKHSNEKNFICNECGRSLKCALSLIYHIKKHNKEYDYVCKECDAKFIQKISLDTHMLRKHVSDTDWPFVCTDCGKRFVLQHHLGVHMTKHSGEKRWKCSFCDKSFRHAVQQRNHELIHKGIKQFVCTRCDKPFTRKTQLDVHMKRHNNQKDFVCANCSGAWVEPSGLRRHSCPLKK